jgi:hypothetical protein
MCVGCSSIAFDYVVGSRSFASADFVSVAWQARADWPANVWYCIRLRLVDGFWPSGRSESQDQVVLDCWFGSSCVYSSCRRIMSCCPF